MTSCLPPKEKRRQRILLLSVSRFTYCLPGQGHPFFQEFKLETDDIIIFRRNGSYLVKRIAACPGDTIVHQNTIMTVPENSYYVLGDNAEYSDDSRYWEDPFVSHEDVIAKLLLPESEERNSGILCASLVGDAHKERSSGLNCTGRPFFSFGGAVTDG